MARTTEITTQLPAETRFVALARVMVASLAAQLGFDLDEIDDLRIAVDEIFSSVVESVESGDVELRFRLTEDEIEVSVAAEGVVGAGPGPDDLSRRILGSVADRFEVGPGAGSFARRRTAT